MFLSNSNLGLGGVVPSLGQGKGPFLGREDFVGNLLGLPDHACLTCLVYLSLGAHDNTTSHSLPSLLGRGMTCRSDGSCASDLELELGV